MKSNKAFFVIRAIIYVAWFAFFTYLFYLECTDVVESDVTAHIRQALQWSHVYSVNALLIRLAYVLGSELGVAILLGILEVATLYLSERFMRKIVPHVSLPATFAFALACNVAIALWLPFVHPHLTQGLSVGNEWHNSTYLVMRLTGLGAIWAYLRFSGRLDSNHHMRDWVVFAVLTVLSAAFKPNFAFSFGLALVILCLYDLVKDRKTLRRSLLTAVPFVLALAIIPIQSAALFGESSSNGIAFGFFSIWRRNHDCVPLGMLQSWAFPLLVLAYCIKARYKDRNVLLAWVYLLVSVAIYAFLREAGPRMMHGNFGWGLSFASYYLMITSVCAYLQLRWDNLKALLHLPSLESGKQEGESRSIADVKSVVFDVCALLLFAWHTISGCILIGSIISGNGYS